MSLNTRAVIENNGKETHLYKLPSVIFPPHLWPWIHTIFLLYALIFLFDFFLPLKLPPTDTNLYLTSKTNTENDGLKLLPITLHTEL